MARKLQIAYVPLVLGNFQISNSLKLRKSLKNYYKKKPKKLKNYNKKRKSEIDATNAKKRWVSMDTNANVYLDFFVESTDTQKSTNVTMTSKENSAKDL